MLKNNNKSLEIAEMETMRRIQANVSNDNKGPQREHTHRKICGMFVDS